MSKPNVTCKWLEMSKCLVNPDGQVVPCCYLANTAIHHTSTDDKALQNRDKWADNMLGGWKTNETLVSYIENKDKYNLNNNNINDILSSDWFNKDLPESWNSYEKIPFACKIFCDANYSKEEEDG